MLDISVAAYSYFLLLMCQFISHIPYFLCAYLYHIFFTTYVPIYITYSLLLMCLYILGVLYFLCAYVYQGFFTSYVPICTKDSLLLMCLCISGILYFLCACLYKGSFNSYVIVFRLLLYFISTYSLLSVFILLCVREVKSPANPPWLPLRWGLSNTMCGNVTQG